MRKRTFTPSYVRRFGYAGQTGSYQIQVAIDEEQLYALIAGRVAANKSGKAALLKGAIQAKKVVTPITDRSVK